MKKSLFLAVMLMLGVGLAVAQPRPAGSPAAGSTKSIPAAKPKKNKKKGSGKTGKKGKKGKKPVTNNSLDPRISS